MVDQKTHPRIRYLFSYLLTVLAAFASYKMFYAFKASSGLGNHVMFLNFGILIFLWFLSFAHTEFIRRNLFMVIILPLAGLHITNLLMVITMPETSFLGYIGFIAASSALIVFSYYARIYEKHL